MSHETTRGKSAAPHQDRAAPDVIRTRRRRPLRLLHAATYAAVRGAATTAGGTLAGTIIYWLTHR